MNAFRQQVLNATRDAELGFATCRECGKRGPFQDCITTMYGGALVFAICIGCAERGTRILIQRGPGGIEVRKSSEGPRLAVASPVGTLTKRPA